MMESVMICFVALAMVCMFVLTLSATYYLITSANAKRRVTKALKKSASDWVTICADAVETVNKTMDSYENLLGGVGKD